MSGPTFSDEELAAIDRHQAGVRRLTDDEVATWLLGHQRPAAEHPTLGPVVTSDPYELTPGCWLMRWWKP